MQEKYQNPVYSFSLPLGYTNLINDTFTFTITKHFVSLHLPCHLQLPNEGLVLLVSGYAQWIVSSALDSLMREKS